jgi:hypothetical protein
MPSALRKIPALSAFWLALFLVILDSDHLQIFFQILDHARFKDNLNRVEIFVDWERFQSVPSELISLRLQIGYGDAVDTASRDFAASLASAYGLPTSPVTLSDLNYELLCLDRLLKHRQRLRKLFHEPRKRTCKSAVNRVA